MRQSLARVALAAGAICVMCGAAQAQTTVSVGLFAGALGEEPVKVLDLPASCGPIVVGPSVPVGVSVSADGSVCLADLTTLLEGATPGSYQVAVREDDGTWGERSLPFAMEAPALPPAPKVCIDPLTNTRYALDAGPPVQVMPNSSVSQRSAWLERERALVKAGFDVRALLVSTSVYFAVTCR
jgi:hypothetical protein